MSDTSDTTQATRSDAYAERAQAAELCERCGKSRVGSGLKRKCRECADIANRQHLASRAAIGEKPRETFDAQLCYFRNASGADVAMWVCPICCEVNYLASRGCSLCGRSGLQHANLRRRSQHNEAYRKRFK